MSRYFVDISEKAQSDLSKLVKHEWVAVIQRENR